jgi:hypothetical protein
VDREIEGLRRLGVQFQCDTIIGKTLSVSDLQQQGFAGIFVGSGAGLPRFMGIPGENLNAVLSCNEYLTRVHPRTAIGYFGPGHYAIVSVFGYRDDLPGVTLEELSAYFAFLGCRQAYNLDGGGSTHLWFHGSERGWPSEACELSDFIYIEDRSREGVP